MEYMHVVTKIPKGLLHFQKVVRDNKLFRLLSVDTKTAVRAVIIANRASGRHMDIQTLKNHFSGHSKIFENNFLKR